MISSQIIQAGKPSTSRASRRDLTLKVGDEQKTPEELIRILVPTIKIDQDLTFQEKQILASIDLSDVAECDFDATEVLRYVQGNAEEVKILLKNGSETVAPDEWQAGEFAERIDEIQKFLDGVESPSPQDQKSEPNADKKPKIRTKHIYLASSWVGGTVRITAGHVHRVVGLYSKSPLMADIGLGLGIAGIATNGADFVWDSGVSLVSAKYYAGRGERKLSYWERLKNRFQKDDRPYRMSGAFFSTAFNVASFIAIDVILKSVFGIAGLTINWGISIVEGFQGVRKYSLLLAKINKDLKSLDEDLIKLGREIDKNDKIIAIRAYLINKINNHQKLSQREIAACGLTPEIENEFNAHPEQFKKRNEDLNSELISRQMVLKYQFAQKEQVQKSLSYFKTKVEKQKAEVKSAHKKSIILNGLIVAGAIAFSFLFPEIAGWVLLGVGLLQLGRRIWNTDLVKKWRGIVPKKLSDSKSSHESEGDESLHDASNDNSPVPSPLPTGISPESHAHESEAVEREQAPTSIVVAGNGVSVGGSSSRVRLSLERANVERDADESKHEKDALLVPRSQSDGLPVSIVQRPRAESDTLDAQRLKLIDESKEVSSSKNPSELERESAGLSRLSLLSQFVATPLQIPHSVVESSSSSRSLPSPRD